MEGEKIKVIKCRPKLENELATSKKAKRIKPANYSTFLPNI